MEKHINVVASTFCLVANNTGSVGKYNSTNFWRCIDTSGSYNVDYITAFPGNSLYYDNLTIRLNDNFDYYEKLFEGLSLAQLRDILYLLVPCASNWVINSDEAIVNTLPHVKMAIKYIEKEISTDNINLITKINSLKNKYDELQIKLDLIINDKLKKIEV